MARRRIITADFLEDAAIHDTEHGESFAMLFLGLVLLADDYGIVQAHPGVIASRVFVFGQRSRADVIAMAHTLIEKGLIVPFMVDGNDFFAIRTWFRHQHLSRPEPLRVCPPPAVIDAIAEGSQEPDLVRAAFSPERQREIVEGRRARAQYAASKRGEKKERHVDASKF